METRVGGIYAELSLDDSRFQRTLNRAEQGFTGLRSAAERAAGQVDRSFSNTGSGIERGGLGARNAARDVQRVGDAAQNAARDVDRIERSAGQAANATRRIDLPAGLAQSASRASDALGRLGERASGMASAGSSMGDSFVGGFAGKLQGLGGKGGPIAMALVGVAGVGVAAGAVLAGAIADGMQMEKDAALIQARLGVSDETMTVIGTAAGDAFSTGWGESVTTNMEAAQAAIESGLLNGTETAGQMQPVIEKLTVVSDLLGEDIPSVARSAGQAIKNGIAKDGTEAFDLLVRAQQNQLNVSHDLLDSFDEYSTELRALGLVGAEGWALVAQGVKAGARDTDVVIDSLKEFKLRVTDGTAEGAAGFDKLGVSAADAQKAMASGGEAARDMMAQLLRGLQKLEDPQDRYNAALALFGTKFEDIQGAAFALNLDTAVQQFGDVAGAADKATQTIGDTTAHRFEAAKNSITSAMDDVKFSIAEAFGPTLQQAADWVSVHRPEIISFFTHLADAGLACLDGLITFGSGALRMFATLQEGIGDSMGKALDVLGGFSSKLGGIIKHIPGMRGVGEAIEGGGNAAQWYGQQMDQAADRARALADKLDPAKPSIDSIRESVRSAGEQASGAAEMTRLLGGAISDIPDGRTVTVTALTDEAKRNLEAFGFKVENLPDGTSTIVAQTDQAQKVLDQFIAHNSDRKITTYTTNEIRDVRVQATRNVGLDPSDGLVQGPITMPDGTNRAAGGVDLDRYADGKLPDTAEIKPATGRLVQWAEPETGGEAFIPLAQSKRSRSMNILSDVAKRFGYDLLRFADGGITVGTVGQNGLAGATAYANTMAGTPYALGGFGPDGIDCSGLVSAVVNKAMGRYAYDSRMSTGSEGAWLTNLGAQLGKGAAGTLRLGWTTQGAAGGHTAGTFPDGTNFESNGNQGVVIGGKVGADDPMFTDHAFFPLGGDAGTAAGVPSTLTGADGSASPAASTPTDASVTATDGTRVYVTNWPDSLGGKTTERTPLASFSARFFANGSENHVAQIAKGGDMRVWAEPETGGEAYIPLSAAKRARSTDILRKVADRFGFSLSPYANGGFGGVGSSGDGGVHTGSWTVLTQGDQGDIPLSTPGKSGGLNGVAQDAYRAVSFLVGGALALRSGWDEDGRFVGFDTSNTAIPGLDGQLEELGTKLDEIVAAAQKPNPVEVSVDIDSGARTANINITQLGL
ncbi:phage tail tape measure protein [Nocardia sp. NPDC051570]|uniref:phage tail tape measure protein n=1 Tax=Nocardia sp. NPDC051570 TaxID=3364324 RepID=UPI0037A5A686